MTLPPSTPFQRGAARRHLPGINTVQTRRETLRQDSKGCPSTLGIHQSAPAAYSDSPEGPAASYPFCHPLPSVTEALSRLPGKGHSPVFGKCRCAPHGLDRQTARYLGATQLCPNRVAVSPSLGRFSRTSTGVLPETPHCPPLLCAVWAIEHDDMPRWRSFAPRSPRSALNAACLRIPRGCDAAGGISDRAHVARLRHKLGVYASRLSGGPS